MIVIFSVTYCDVAESALVGFVLNWVQKVFETVPPENIIEEQGDIFEKLFEYVKLVVF